MRRSRRAAIAGALLVFAVVAVGCKKKKVPIEIEAGPALPEATADVEAKETVATIVSVYPVACDSDAAGRAWTACREAGGGYGKLYSCAEKGQRDTKAALAMLRPSTGHTSACADEIDKTAVALLNAAPRFFADELKWLQEKHEALVPVLEKMALGEACRTQKELCAGEPHDWDDAYKAMRMHALDTIECTTKIFKCGTKDSMDCWLSNVVPRLGVACAGTANRTGSSPEDLLYVRETGLPIAR